MMALPVTVSLWLPLAKPGPGQFPKFRNPNSLAKSRHSMLHS